MIRRVGKVPYQWCVLFHGGVVGEGGILRLGIAAIGEAENLGGALSRCTEKGAVADEAGAGYGAGVTDCGGGGVIEDAVFEEADRYREIEAVGVVRRLLALFLRQLVCVAVDVGVR